MIQRVLNQLRSLREEAEQAPKDGGYNSGYLDAVDYCIDIVENLMWEEGIDDEGS